MLRKKLKRKEDEMGGIRIANKTHYKGWTAKLQRVWRKDDDKDGVITIIEDLMVPDKFTVHLRGKQYAKVEPPADMDSAIHVANLSYTAWGLGSEEDENLDAFNPRTWHDNDVEVGELDKLDEQRCACCNEDVEFIQRSIEEDDKGTTESIAELFGENPNLRKRTIEDDDMLNPFDLRTGPDTEESPVSIRGKHKVEYDADEDDKIRRSECQEKAKE